jgi:hypothetical protein
LWLAARLGVKTKAAGSGETPQNRPDWGKP